MRHMKKLFLTLALLIPVSAEAQSCVRVPAGYFSVYRRLGFFCGRNACIRLACTRWVPYQPYWHGGTICTGGRLYGRIGLYGPLWSCKILGFQR